MSFIDELMEHGAFPHVTSRPRLKETALSWVLLTGRCAYKIKKPLKLDYVDASTPARRRSLCEQELRLNRRFAPDLYLNVVPIARIRGRLRTGVKSGAVEYAVRMRQFGPQLQLSELLRRGRVDCEEMWALGAQIAADHQAARRAPAASQFGRPKLVRRQMIDNIISLKAQIGDGVDRRTLARIERWATATSKRLKPMIEARRASGRVRQCHGDLHAGNIVSWRAKWVTFDCLEFDPRLRWIDVLSDLAFIYMDLLARDRNDLAHAVLNGYLERSGDYAGLPLLSLYAAYRALVRALVHALEGKPRSGGEVRRYLRTAVRLTRPVQRGLLIMNGLSGSGKSALSRRLVTVLPAVRIRSDVERKRTLTRAAAFDQHRSSRARLYSTASTRRTYAYLLKCAEAALEYGGGQVIVDATFLKEEFRSHFHRLARRSRVPLLIVCCQAPLTTLRRRIRSRAETSDVSDADLVVLEAQRATLEPLMAAERRCAITSETGGRFPSDKLRP